MLRILPAAFLLAVSAASVSAQTWVPVVPAPDPVVFVDSTSVVKTAHGAIALVRFDHPYVAPIGALGHVTAFGTPAHEIEQRQFDCAHDLYKVLKVSRSAMNVSASKRVWVSSATSWTRATPGSTDGYILDYVCALADPSP